MHIHMYLPDDYMLHESYPVLYMFDGHNLFLDEDATFGTAWHLDRHLGGDYPEMIVVGVECSHHGNDRISEYSPFDFFDKEYGNFNGLAMDTMHFFVHDLKPYIEAHYPANPSRETTFIGGSSCGGLMAIYALYRYSHIYSKALAISPFVIPVESQLMNALSRSRIRKNSSIYLSWGAREGHTGHEFVLETKICTDMANILIKKGVDIHFNVKLYGMHTEADWEAEADEFVRFLLP